MERTTTRAVHIGLAAVMILAVLAAGLAPTLLSTSSAHAAETAPAPIDTDHRVADVVGGGLPVDWQAIRDAGGPDAEDTACYAAALICGGIGIFSPISGLGCGIGTATYCLCNPSLQTRPPNPPRRLLPRLSTGHKYPCVLPTARSTTHPPRLSTGHKYPCVLPIARNTTHRPKPITAIASPRRGNEEAPARWVGASSRLLNKPSYAQAHDRQQSTQNCRD